jgi:hypothetical protein
MMWRMPSLATVRGNPCPSHPRLRRPDAQVASKPLSATSGWLGLLAPRRADLVMRRSRYAGLNVAAQTSRAHAHTLRRRLIADPRCDVAANRARPPADTTLTLRKR